MGEVGNSEPSVSPTGVSWVGKAFLFAAPLLMLVAAWGGAIEIKGAMAEPRDISPPVSDAEPDGPMLFARHCARCHGERGDGNGLTSIEPKARYFGYDPYKLASTTNGIPTDDDLVRLLRRGIPGTSMESFEPILSEPQMHAIIGHLRELTRRGIYARLQKKAIKDDDYEPLEVATKALAQSQIGPVLDVPTSFAPPSAASIAQGKIVYTKACANCHGPDGNLEAAEVKVLLHDNGTPIRPRNFLTGVFKGGSEPNQLYLRIMLGVPGTPMSANKSLSRTEVEDLINYVRSMAGSK